MVGEQQKTLILNMLQIEDFYGYKTKEIKKSNDEEINLDYGDNIDFY